MIGVTYVQYAHETERLFLRNFSTMQIPACLQLIFPPLAVTCMRREA